MPLTLKPLGPVMGVDMRRQTWIVLSAIALTLAVNLSAGEGLLPPRSCRQWEYAEWVLPRVSFRGNPFDLIAEVTFEHESGKETRMTEMYYAGDGKHWRFRFATG